MKIIAALITPPGCLVLLGALALVLGCVDSSWGIALGTLAVALAWIASTPALAVRLTRGVSSEAAIDGTAQAIVVPGRGYAIAGGKPRLPAKALERVHRAAELHRATQLPVCVSGGDPGRAGSSEAAVMKRALEEDFGVPVRWIEDRALDTRGNARLCFAILEREEVRSILVVTQAAEMPRALEAFRRAGFEAQPAPVPHALFGSSGVMRFFPSASAMEDVSVAIYERLASLWYGVSK